MGDDGDDDKVEGPTREALWIFGAELLLRDKYQSMKCNIHNKIKSIYMSMRYFL